jgi:hypothetical protein
MSIERTQLRDADDVQPQLLCLFQQLLGHCRLSAKLLAEGDVRVDVVGDYAEDES